MYNDSGQNLQTQHIWSTPLVEIIDIVDGFIIYF